MNTHVKNASGVPADLSRRSFLVGTAAAGLALGYSAVPGLLGADQALAAPANFDPSVWYSIGPDGIVTVTCGKADMGQHIASTMAQIVSEELGSSWKDMRVQLASNDPKFNDPVLGAQITGGSWSTMMNFDAMSRAGAAGRIALTQAAATIWHMAEETCWPISALPTITVTLPSGAIEYHEVGPKALAASASL